MTYKEPNGDFYRRHDLEEGDPRIRYIVTSGEYSDYKIRGVFDSDKARAEVYAEKICGRVEEYEVNLEQQTIPEEWAWVVRMKRDGSCTVHREDMEERADELSGEGGFGYARDWMAHLTLGYMGDPEMIADVYAKDEAGAAKIANEYRARAITDGFWTTTAPNQRHHMPPKYYHLKSTGWEMSA